MLSIKQASIILNKAQIPYQFIVPNSGNRLHIHTPPGFALNKAYIQKVIEAFEALSFRVERLANPMPQHPLFANQWLTLIVKA